MEQVQSDLHTLERLYGLVHKGPTDDNLDEESRAYLVRLLNDATQKALKRQGELISGSPMPPVVERNLSIRSDLRTSESLNPPPSRSLSLHNVVSEGLHRLNLQHSPSSSGRDGRHANDPRHAAEEPPVLSRLASNRSSRTAMPPRLYPSREHLNSSLSLNRLSVSATSQHGTVIGRSPRADPRDRTLPPPIYDRSDHSALHVIEAVLEADTTSLSCHGATHGSGRFVLNAVPFRETRGLWIVPGRGVASWLRASRTRRGFAQVPVLDFEQRSGHDTQPYQEAPATYRQNVAATTAANNTISISRHHHQQPGGQEAPSLRTDRCELNHKDKSLRKHIGGMFHRTKGKEKKKTGSQTMVSVSSKKKRGGAGHMFGGAMLHFRGKLKKRHGKA